MTAEIGSEADATSKPYSKVDLMKLKTFFPFLVLALFMGCATPKNVIVLMPDAGGKVGAIELRNRKGAVTLDKGGHALYVKDDKSLPAETKPVSDAEVKTMFAEAIDVQPAPPAQFILYFEFNSNKLTPASDELMIRVIDTIKQRNSDDISVTGHSDRAGSKKYNMSLSLKRAKLVRDILIAKGVAPETIQTTSHGEGNPLIPTDDNVPEPKNRRVEVIVR
jgi:outer membrane protein OmpA-like peptidoglycan-associated protein